VRGNRRVRFQGREYLLIGDLTSGGAIATQEQFDNFENSYAHLGEDGVVRRYGAVIGRRADVEDLGPDDEFAGKTINVTARPRRPLLGAAEKEEEEQP